MKEQIEAILADVPHKVNKVGNLWQVSIGEKHAGARENGKALARDLLARYRREVLEAPTRSREPRDPVYVNDPAMMEELQRLRTAEKARTAEEALMRGLDKLEEKHAEMQAKAQEIERQEGDMFDTSQLQDLIRENEPHAEAQRRWQADYNQLTNRLVDNRLPPLSPTEREYQRRLQAALYMGRMGAVEIL